LAKSLVARARFFWPGLWAILAAKVFGCFGLGVVVLGLGSANVQ
jgi:hypothetical protein